MKPFTFLFIYLFTVLIFHAQAQEPAANQNRAVLIGKLIDEKGQAITYANVALLHAEDSTLITTTLTKTDGKFSIPSLKGRFILKCTSIGFVEKTTAAFELSDSLLIKDLGTIILQVESKALQNVSVTALRPSIVQLADKMVVSVEGTAMAAGNTAYAVLSRAPGVFIDAEGNIQLNGRSGVTVMLDGKLTYLSARDLRTLLESMPAENLKNIEIITNPSAKYDAEGTSGILNINLKKNTQQGLNGFVQSSYNYNFKQQHGGTLAGRINYKNGRWNSFISSDVSRRVGGRDATFTRVFNAPSQTIYFDQIAEGNYLINGLPTVRLGTDYNITSNHSVGIMGSFIKSKSEQDFLTDTYIGNAPKTPSQFVEADNISVNTYRNFTSNIHYTGKLDTLGTLLTSDLDYVRIRNRGYTDMLNYYSAVATGQKTSDFLFTNTPNSFTILSGKVDLVLPSSKGNKFEAGLKASRVVADNDFEFFFNNNGLNLDPLRTNHFKYQEKIYAAYINGARTLSKKWSVQGGLRVEHTASIANLITTNNITNRNYTNLFPSLFFQQKVSDEYGINYSYSRRLNRPSYGSLNIFKAYRDPFTYSQGNPFLRPQFTHAFSVAQIFNRRYLLTINYNIFKDALAEVPIIDVNEGITVYTTSNLNSGKEYGMTAVAPIKIMKKWDTQNTLTLFHNKNTMETNLGKVVNNQLLVSYQSVHTILLPKDIRLELNMFVRGPAANGLYRMASLYRIDAAVKKSLLKKKIDVTANVVDIFKSFRYLWTANIAGNISDFDQYFRVRTVGFSIRYNFSRGSQVDQKRRSNTVEEVNRTN
jgi:hypothetical protein